MLLLKNCFSPIPVRCMRQGAQGDDALDDPEGWDGAGGEREAQDGEHMYTHGWFMWMYGKTHQNNNNNKIKKWKTDFPVFFCHFHFSIHPVPSPSIPHHGVKKSLKCEHTNLLKLSSEPPIPHPFLQHLETEKTDEIKSALLTMRARVLSLIYMAVLFLASSFTGVDS